MKKRLKTLLLAAVFCHPCLDAETVKLESRVTKDTRTSLYDLFSESDSKLYNAYMDRWSYHEKDIAYSMARGSNEHRDPSILGSAPLEMDFRKDFGNGILRERLSTLGMHFYEPLKKIKELRPIFFAAAAYHTITHPNALLVIEKNSLTPTLVKVGYDLPADSALLEISRGSLRTGIYQDGIFQAVTARKQVGSATVKLGADLEDRVTTVSFGYGVSSGSLSSALARRLSRRMQGEINSSLETRNTSQWSTGVKVSYSF